MFYFITLGFLTSCIFSGSIFVTTSDESDDLITCDNSSDQCCVQTCVVHKRMYRGSAESPIRMKMRTSSISEEDKMVMASLPGQLTAQNKNDGSG